MERRIDVSFGVTVKNVSLADLLPLLEEFRKLAGDGKLKLNRETERLLQRQAAAALPLLRPAAVVEGDGELPSVEGDGRRHTFGELVRALRIQKDLTQEALAQRVGMERVYISKVERGERLPKINTCERLAQGLGCDLTMLHLKVAEEWSARRQRELGLPAQA